MLTSSTPAPLWSAAPGTLRINSGGAVFQNSAGVISAANLGVLANGTIKLDQVPNQVSGVLSMADSGSNSPIRYLSAGAITLGSIAAANCYAVATSGVS